MDKRTDCLACDLAAGRRALPGGLIFETPGWRVEHCTRPLGVGTLIVKPKRHVLRVADLSSREALEMGPLLHQTASAVQQLTETEQVYVCLWSHGPVHIHYVVQPAPAGTTSDCGLYGPRLQAAQFDRGDALDTRAAGEFADQARNWFERASGSSAVSGCNDECRRGDSTTGHVDYDGHGFRR